MKTLLIDIEIIPGYPDYGVEFKTDTSRPEVVRLTKDRRGCDNRGRRLSQWMNSSGYLTVKLTKPGTKGKAVPIHTIVALVTLGPRPKGWTVNHKDANKLNNTPDNLEYCSIADNVKHATALGLHVKGEGIWTSKLTKAKVRDLRRKAKAGMAYTDLSNEYGVGYRQVWMVVTGRSWAHV